MFNGIETRLALEEAVAVTATLGSSRKPGPERVSDLMNELYLIYRTRETKRDAKKRDSQTNGKAGREEEIRTCS